MKRPPVVSRAQWLAERKELLAREKELTRLSDEISALRRQLPWVEIRENYRFMSDRGEVSLAELFAGQRQLVVYHFMFGPEWQQGCVSCSFWADNFNGLSLHLAQRDISLVMVSRTALSNIQAFRSRMGWEFNWVSSLGTTFNRDFDVSFPADEMDGQPGNYNYRERQSSMEEAPGLSVFYRDDDDTVYHCYSCYGRGLDVLNSAYQIMDRVPLGRNEDEFEFPMAWVRHHDRYNN